MDNITIPQIRETHSKSKDIPFKWTQISGGVGGECPRVNADCIYRNVLSVQLKKNQKDKTPYTQVGVLF